MTATSGEAALDFLFVEDFALFFVVAIYVLALLTFQLPATSKQSLLKEQVRKRG